MGEITAVLKLTRKRAALLRQAIWVDSLIPLGDQLNLDSSVIEQLIDERCMTPDDAISEADLIDLIYKQLNCLDLREVRVLSMRYGLDGAEERTLREVGEILNLTRERVRQIEKQALERLRCHLELFDPDATRRQCQRPRHTT